MAEGFWRVYRREWTVVYSSDATGADGQAECERRRQRAGGGAVPAEAFRVVPWSRDDPGGYPWMLEVNILVMKGEYRELADAERHETQIGGEVCREGSKYDRHQQDLLHKLTAVTA